MRQAIITLTKIRYVFTILFISVLLVSCKKSDEVTQPAPVISAIATPGGLTSGPKNTVLTLRGTNFITDLSQIQVTINSKNCTVLSATDTAIKVTVPPACGSGNVMLRMGGVNYTGPFFTFIYTYTLSTFTNGLVGYVDGPYATAKIEELVGITIDGNDNIYNAQYTNPRVRKIAADSTVSTVAGDGTVGHTNANGTAAQFGNFDFCSSDAAGNIYVADNSGYIRKIDVSKNVTDFVTFAAGISPEGIKVMPSGNVYIQAYDRIGKITSGGTLSWLAISAAGSGDVDGTVGTAQFSLYGGIEVSSDESKIYVNDFTHGTNTGNKVKVLDVAAHTITTIAGKTGLSDGDGDALNVGFKLISCTLLDSNGGLYIADAFNNKIKYLKNGQVTTFIGAAGGGDVDGDISVAKISYPHGMVWDSHGNLYISNVSINKIKKLTID